MRLISILILCMLLSTPVLGARLPEDGDYVNIFVQSVEERQICYTGFVTGISDGLICMDCKWSGLFAGDEIIPIEGGYPMDICIGTGQITLLNWKEVPSEYKVENKS